MSPISLENTDKVGQNLGLENRPKNSILTYVHTNKCTYVHTNIPTNAHMYICKFVSSF